MSGERGYIINSNFKKKNEKNPEIIIQTLRKLRKKMTDSEKILWSKLKSNKLKNIKILRQVHIYVYEEKVEKKWFFESIFGKTNNHTNPFFDEEN